MIRGGNLRSVTVRYISPQGKKIQQAIQVHRSFQRLLILQVEDQSSEVTVNEHKFVLYSVYRSNSKLVGVDVGTT